MATITANITSSATLIPLSAEVEIGYYTIDSENIYVTGMSRGADGRDFTRDTASVDRAVGGSTAASHTSGATLTRYYPDAVGGGASVQVVYSLTTNLTDAQIKALPTTPVEVLSGQGVGTVANVLAATVVTRTPGYVGYTNLDATAILRLRWKEGLSYSDHLLASPLTVPSGRSSLLNGDYPAAWCRLAGNTSDEGLVRGLDDVPGLDAGVYLDLNNQGAGDLTGGNAANSASVTVLYTVTDAV